MAFDADRYRREVLEPARAAGNRPTDDLLARYQLLEPLSLARVKETIPAVTAYWHKQRGTLAFKTVVDALEADHRRLHEVLQQAVGGDLRPLTDEVKRWRDRRRDRLTRLSEALHSLAGPMRRLTPSVVDAMMAEGHHRIDVDTALRTLGVDVQEPETLPTTAPVRTFDRLRTDLRTLSCRHIADFLFGPDVLAPGFTVLDRFAITGSPARLDQTVVAEKGRVWAGRLDGKTVAEGVLTVLRPLSPEQLRELLAYECIHDLREQRSLGHHAEGLRQRASGLGLAETEAMRLAFAVSNERTRSVLATRLEGLLDRREVFEAQRLVEGRGRDGIPADCQTLADRVAVLVTTALSTRDEAVAATDPDDAWRLLDDAETIAADLPDAERLRHRWPPRPAGRPVAHIDGTRVVLVWPPSGSRVGAVGYRVTRADRSPSPGHVLGVLGDLVAETVEPRTVDPTPPVNTALFYAVVARRGGVDAAPAVADPVWYRPEVDDLRVTAADRAISAAWRLPSGAVGVTVRRADGRPPRDPDDGVAVSATATGFSDRSVRNGTAYHYLVSVRYPRPEGDEAYTPGRRFTAVATPPPQPVRTLSLAAAADQPGWLVATFAAPSSGTVELRLLDQPPAQPWGTVMPAAQAPGHPVPAVATVGRLRCRAPGSAAVLLAVTVDAGLATIGAYHEWVPQPDPPVVHVHRHGHGVLVSWEWTADVVEMQVRWRAGDGAWQTQLVSHAGYWADGGLHLTPSAGAPVEILVAPVVRAGDRRLVGAPGRAVVNAPIPARYTLHRRRSRHQVVVTVSAERAVRVSRLLLIHRDDVMPLQSTDGEVVATWEDIGIDPDRSVLLQVPLPGHARRGWLRCFALDEGVVLADPPAEQLRKR